MRCRLQHLLVVTFVIWTCFCVKTCHVYVTCASNFPSDSTDRLSATPQDCKTVPFEVRGCFVVRAASMLVVLCRNKGAYQGRGCVAMLRCWVEGARAPESVAKDNDNGHGKVT